MHFRVLPDVNRVSDLPPNEPAIGYRVGGGEMKSVIPRKRKLVKTMIYHCIKDFLISLLRPSPELHDRRQPIAEDL